MHPSSVQNVSGAQWGAGTIQVLSSGGAAGQRRTSMRAGQIARAQLRVAGGSCGPPHGAVSIAARGNPILNPTPGLEQHSHGRKQASRLFLLRGGGGGSGTRRRRHVAGAAAGAGAADDAEGGRQALSMLAPLLAGMQQPQEAAVPTGAHLAIHGLTFQPPGADSRAWEYSHRAYGLILRV